MLDKTITPHIYVVFLNNDAILILLANDKYMDALCVSIYILVELHVVIKEIMFNTLLQSAEECVVLRSFDAAALLLTFII